MNAVTIENVLEVVNSTEKFECEIPDEKLLITEMDTVQKMIDILQTLYDEQKNG